MATQITKKTKNRPALMVAKGTNADLLVAIGEPIPEIPLEDKRLRDIVRAVELYGSLQYDRRAKSLREQARIRILELAHAFSADLQLAHDQLLDSRLQIEDLTKEISALNLANKQLQSELPFNLNKKEHKPLKLKQKTI